MMEITAKALHAQRVSEGCYIQRFFRNKVFYGIDNQPLKGRFTEENVIRMEREKMRYFMLMRSRIFE